MLVGEESLRGYKQIRFGGMAYGVGNIELRSKLVDFRFKNQNFGLSAVPFFDFGRAWDGVADINLNLSEFKYSPGIGARIAWNQSTIIRLDFSWTQEDSQFFFVFGQTF